MADETAKLILAVDSTSAKTATADLDKLTESSAKAEAATGKLGTTSGTAGRAVKASADATSAAAVSAEQLAETEQQAAKRIHDMVQASLAAVEASKANAAASAAATRATSEGAAASKALAEAQTAQMQRWTALRAPVVEVQTLLSKSKLTTAEVAKAEQLLDRAQAAGVITSGELAEAFAILDAAKVKDIAVTEAQSIANKSAGLSSRAQSEIATAASEIAAGNFSRLRRTGAAFANQAGLLTKLMSPMGLAILGVSGTVIALVTAFAKGEAEQAAFNKALILTGDYAGKTTLQLESMAESLAGVGGATQHAAAGALAQVVQSGQFFGKQIETVTKAALELQQTTGQAVDETIQQFVKLGKDPVQGLLDLNQSMHFLTQSTYDQVTALVQRGEKDKAAQVAQDAYASAVKQRAQDVQQNLGFLEKAWNGVAGAAKGAWDRMLDVGRPETIDQKITDIGNKLSVAQDQLRTGVRGTAGLSASQINAGLQSQQIDPDQVRKTIANLQAQLKDLQFQKLTGGNIFAAGQSLANREIGDRIAAQQALNSGAGASAQSTLNARLNELATQKAKALMGVVDPDKRQSIIVAFNAQVAEAAHQYDSAIKKLTPHASKANPLSGLQGLVNSTGVSSLVIPNDKPTTEYVQTVAKLTTAFDQARAKGADLGAAEDLFAKGVAAANLKLKEQQDQIQQGNDRAFAQFKATLDEQVAAQKNAVDIQVASVGMGQKEAEQARQLNALDQQRIQQVQRLEHAQATHPEQYAELQRQIDAVNASFGDMRDTMLDGFHRTDAAQSDWRNGALAAMQDFIDAGKNVAGQMQTFIGGAFDAMTDAIGNFATTGKGDVKSLVLSILSDFAKMEARIAESKLLSAFIGSYTGTGQGTMATSMDSNGTFFSFANGGTFDSPSLSRYSGGVYDSPHLFKFANGGVFGEAGTEAIMPLTRGADGKLGVRADGTGTMSVTVNQTYQTSNSGASGSDQSRGEQNDAIRQFQKRMKDTAKQTILDEQRPGGSLWRMAHA